MTLCFLVTYRGHFFLKTTDFRGIFMRRINTVITRFCIFLKCVQINLPHALAVTTHANHVTFEHVTLSNMICVIPIQDRPIDKFVLTILLDLKLSQGSADDGGTLYGHFRDHLKTLQREFWDRLPISSKRTILVTLFN